MTTLSFDPSVFHAWTSQVNGPHTFMTTLSFDPSVFHGRDPWSREAVMSPPTTRQAQMGKVFGDLKGLHATHLINTGVKLGLLARLAQSPRCLSKNGWPRQPIPAWC
jgi:hypothetical protein